MSLFPARSYEEAGSFADDYFELFSQGARSVDRGALTEAGQLLGERARAGRTLFCCGNGGSAAIANHLVCDCLKGVRANSTLRPRVQSLSTPIELVTAIANDFGVEHLFSFPLESLAASGDVLIAISSSGNSPNIIRAIEKAKDLGLPTVAMTGFDGGKASELADISLHVKINNYGVVEDVHQSLMHIMAQYLRQAHIEDAGLLGKLKF